MDKVQDVLDAIYSIWIGIIVASFLVNTNRGLKAIDLCKECLVILNNIAGGNEAVDREFVKNLLSLIYSALFRASCVVHDYTNAEEYGREVIKIHLECGAKVVAVRMSIALAEIFIYQGKCDEAKDLYDRIITIAIETGDKEREAYVYYKIGSLSFSVFHYVKAADYIKRALAIEIEINHKEGEARCYKNLGVVFQRLGQYNEAKNCIEKALAIRIDVGDIEGQGQDYEHLGMVLTSLAQ